MIHQNTYKPITDFEDKLISTEITALRSLLSTPIRNHTIYCFSDEQVKRLVKEIKTKFKRYNLKIKYYTCSINPLMFRVELSR